jgi:hypothetical protein
MTWDSSYGNENPMETKEYDLIVFINWGDLTVPVYLDSFLCP